MKKILLASVFIIILAAAASASTYVITQKMFATFTEKDLDLITQYSIEKDSEAVVSMFLQNRAFWVEPGEKVGLLKAKIGSVKLHYVGDTREFWTYREAIKKAQ